MGKTYMCLCALASLKNDFLLWHPHPHLWGTNQPSHALNWWRQAGVGVGVRVGKWLLTGLREARGHNCTCHTREGSMQQSQFPTQNTQHTWRANSAHQQEICGYNPRQAVRDCHSLSPKPSCIIISEAWQFQRRALSLSVLQPTL